MAWLCVTATVFAAAGQQDNKNATPGDVKAPKLTLKAQPTVSISPARVVLTADLTGGPNDYQDFYCPTVEWDWGDGTTSASTFDCEPYQAGKSEIKRHFTVVHVFRAGAYQVVFRLKRNDKTLASASVLLQVQPGARDNRED